MHLDHRIVADPQMLDGRPVIEGTQVRAGGVLEQIAAGKSVEQAARDLAISVEDAHAALAYAARRLDAPIAGDDPLLALAGIIDSGHPGWADDHDRLFGDPAIDDRSQ